MTKQTNNALFHTKTLNNVLVNFSFPPDLQERHKIIQKWIETLETGTLDQVKEVSLHGDFLKDVFQEVLGYRSVIGGGDEEPHPQPISHYGKGSKCKYCLAQRRKDAKGRAQNYSIYMQCCK